MKKDTGYLLPRIPKSEIEWMTIDPRSFSMLKMLILSLL
jgi:hypothetical protein